MIWSFVLGQRAGRRRGAGLAAGPGGFRRASAREEDLLLKHRTELPPREVLEERLHRAIEAARNRLGLGAAGVDAVIDVAPTRGATLKRKGRKK
jgi:hypothetical protein